MPKIGIITIYPSWKITLQLQRSTRSIRSENQTSAWPCSKWGLHCRFHYRKRGSLLHCLFTLTFITRYVFCCTLCHVTPTNRHFTRPVITRHFFRRSPDFTSQFLFIIKKNCAVISRLCYFNFQALLQNPLHRHHRHPNLHHRYRLHHRKALVPARRRARPPYPHRFLLHR